MFFQSYASGTAPREAIMTGESHIGTVRRRRSFSRRMSFSGISNTRPVIISTHTGRERPSGRTQTVALSNPSASDGRLSENQKNRTVLP